MQRLAETGAEVLSETLNRLAELTPLTQDESLATFAPLLKRADGLIDWTTEAAAIERRVRGFQPWPNAYTYWKGQRLILWSAAPDDLQDSASPGDVIAAQGDDIVVSCGQQSALRVLELQLEGKRRLSARDFLNGTHLKIGDRFGQD